MGGWVWVKQLMNIKYDVMVDAPRSASPGDCRDRSDVQVCLLKSADGFLHMDNPDWGRLWKPQFKCWSFLWVFFKFNFPFVFSCSTFVSCLHIDAVIQQMHSYTNITISPRYFCGCSTCCDWNVCMPLVALTTRFYDWSFCSPLTTSLFFLYSANHLLSVDCGCLCIQARVWPPRVRPWPPSQVDWKINSQCILLHLCAFTVALSCDQVLCHYTVTEEKKTLMPCVEKNSIPLSRQYLFSSLLYLTVILLQSSYCSSCTSE